MVSSSFVITRWLRRLERGRGVVTGAPIPRDVFADVREFFQHGNAGGESFTGEVVLELIPSVEDVSSQTASVRTSHLGPHGSLELAALLKSYSPYRFSYEISGQEMCISINVNLDNYIKLVRKIFFETVPQDWTRNAYQALQRRIRRYNI